MIDLKVNESKKFNFQLLVSGIQANDLKGSMKLIIEGIEYGFPIKLFDGSVVVELPPLDKITKAELTEGQSLPVSLEIIANDTLIIPWEDSFKVIRPAKVETSMVNIKEVIDEVKISLINIKEESVKKEEKKKVDVKPIKHSKIAKALFGDI